jgi:hypothetical protein
MNRLSTDKRTQVIAALVEGTSINATCRMTGVAKHTVLNLLRDLGCVHKTLRVTPAMEAGIAYRVWSLEELIGLLLPDLFVGCGIMSLGAQKRGTTTSSGWVANVVSFMRRKTRKPHFGE